MTQSSDSTPLVSIVITYYRLPHYVEETIKSCIVQTYPYIEILLVDDHSDETVSETKLNEIKKRYPSVKQIIHKERMGSAVARNSGIQKARGMYICCLDADDKFEPSYVCECVKRFAGNADLGFVTSWMQVFGKSNHIIKSPSYVPSKILSSDPFSSASMFPKKRWEEVGGFDKVLGTFTDWDFWISLLEKGYTWEVIEKPLIWYRNRANSRSKITSEKKYILMRKLISKHKRIFEQYLEDVVIDLHSYCDRITHTKGWLMLDRIRSIRDRIIRILSNRI